MLTRGAECTFSLQTRVCCVFLLPPLAVRGAAPTNSESVVVVCVAALYARCRWFVEVWGTKMVDSKLVQVLPWLLHEGLARCRADSLCARKWWSGLVLKVAGTWQSCGGESSWSRSQRRLREVERTVVMCCCRAVDAVGVAVVLMVAELRPVDGGRGCHGWGALLQRWLESRRWSKTAVAAVEVDGGG